MKIAYVTDSDPRNVKAWSGLLVYITQALERQGAEVIRLGPFPPEFSWWDRIRRRYYKKVLR